MAETPPQTGPIAVYGATGYTGRLVAAELRRRGADFVLAGRNRAKLEILAEDLGGEIAIRDASLDDPAALRALLEPCAAVIACAGPFQLHGEPVLAAAVETRTHYLDTTGEQPFMRKVFEDYGPQRRAGGVALVTAMGFDYVPGDMIAALTAEGMGRSTRSCSPTRYGLRRHPGHGAVGAGDDGRRRRGVARRRAGLGAAERRARELGLPGAGRPPADGPLPGRRAHHRAAARPDPAGADAAHRLDGDLPAARPPGRPAGDGAVPARHAHAAAAGAGGAGPSPAGGPERGEPPQEPFHDRLRGAAGLARRRGTVTGSDLYGLTARTTVEGALRCAAPGYDRRGALAPSQAFDPGEFLGALGGFGVEYEVE